MDYLYLDLYFTGYAAYSAEYVGKYQMFDDIAPASSNPVPTFGQIWPR